MDETRRAIIEKIQEMSGEDQDPITNAMMEHMDIGELWVAYKKAKERLSK